MNLTNYDKINELLASGNIDQFSPKEKLEYINRICEATGLNPLTRPFDYLRFQGRTVLYANKGCADQLRKINNISIQVTDKKIEEGVLFITVEGKDSSGRVDTDIGALPVGTLKGDQLANAVMKCLTKAKRRLTLSMCGLGILDESEFDTMTEVIKDARPQLAQMERTNQVVEKALSEDYEAKNDILQIITGHLSALSKGKSVEEKSILLSELCGVKRFADLKTKSNEELSKIANELKEITQETKEREEKPAKPSFKLEG
jgi:uncharacterized phage infection (PIP) family protein YhgE